MSEILRGLRLVGTVSGRDGRDQFWPYALLVFFALMAVTMVLFLPTFSETLGRMQQFAVAHPDQAQVTAGPGSYSIQIRGNPPGLMPDMGPYMRNTGAAMVVAILLWAAAVIRRLHDAGRTALWGLLPLPFMGFAVWGMPRVFAGFGASDTLPPLFVPIFLSNWLYLASVAWLVFLLVKPSTEGPSRYGPMPPQPIRRPPPPLGRRRD